MRLGTVDLHTSLKASERGSTGGHRRSWGRGGRLRGLLVAGELALCVMVLIAAGLLVRSFARVQRRRPQASIRLGVLTLELTMAGRKYADAARVYETYRSLWERLARAARRDCGGRSHGTSAQPDVCLGTDHRRGTERAGRGEVHQRGHPHRRRRVLPGDGDPARARQVLHRPGHARDADRRRRRPAHGRGAVARAGRRRQTDPHRRIRRQAGHAVDDGDRRRRTSQAVRARWRRSAGSPCISGTSSVHLAP